MSPVAKFVSERVAFRLLAGFRPPEPMRLIEHNNIPEASLDEPCQMLIALGEIKRDYDILPEAHLFGVFGSEVPLIDLEGTPELGSHLIFPLLGQRRRTHD